VLTPFQEMDGLDGEESSTTRCLQDYIDEISNAQCRDMVQRYKQLAAEDIRFDVPLADACASDRKSLCGSIPPVRCAPLHVLCMNWWPARCWGAF
jgi:Golgi apparatus protein 1